MEACNERGLAQLVEIPKHIKGNTLDLVLTDKPERLISLVSAGRLGKSDHNILLVELDMAPAGERRRERVKNWRKEDWKRIRESMSGRDWSMEMRDLNAEEAWKLLKGSLEELVNIHVPLREVRTADRPP